MSGNMRCMYQVGRFVCLPCILWNDGSHMWQLYQKDNSKKKQVQQIVCSEHWWTSKIFGSKLIQKKLMFSVSTSSTLRVFCPHYIIPATQMSCTPRCGRHHKLGGATPHYATPGFCGAMVGRQLRSLLWICSFIPVVKICKGRIHLQQIENINQGDSTSWDD